MTAVVAHESASVTLRPIAYNVVWLTNLHSEELMKGHAKELMQEIVDKADAQEIILQLDVRDHGESYGMDIGALILFYEGFDFYHLTGGGKHLMERSPRMYERFELGNYFQEEVSQE